MEQVENFKENEDVDYSKVRETSTPVISMYAPMEEESGLMVAAENIFIYGSIPIDLPDTKRVDLIDEKLNLILMYAIGSGARQKTETVGKIALGIKESMLNDEQIAAYKSIKYLMFHYWSNPKAYQLTSEPMFVDKNAVPEDYLIRLEKDAVKFLLLEYNPLQSVDLGNINILKTQRRGEIRYLPFVTTLESIKDE
jgi:type I restriction enzyme R subunit